MRKLLTALLLFTNLFVSAQKKSLTHDVYDGWKSVGERAVSNDGHYAVYAINPQEGDGTLIIQDLRSDKKIIAERGYNAVISSDNKYVFFKIKPHFQRHPAGDELKRKKPDEMPKDSLGMHNARYADSITRIPLGKKLSVSPEKAGRLAGLPCWRSPAGQHEEKSIARIPCKSKDRWS